MYLISFYKCLKTLLTTVSKTGLQNKFLQNLSAWDWNKITTNDWLCVRQAQCPLTSICHWVRSLGQNVLTYCFKNVQLLTWQENQASLRELPHLSQILQSVLIMNETTTYTHLNPVSTNSHWEHMWLNNSN